MAYDLFAGIPTNELNDFSNLTIYSLLETFGQNRVPMVFTLKELLNNYTKNTLLEITFYNHIEVRKSWSKKVIVEEATEQFKRTLEGRLLLLSQEQYTLYKKAIKNPFLREKDPRAYHLFIIKVLPVTVKLGLTFITSKNNQLTLTFPEEVTMLLNTESHLNNHSLNEKIQSFQTILNASLNLYGVVDFSILMRLKSIASTEEGLTPDDMSDFYHYVSLIAIAQGHYVLDFKIASQRFDNDYHAQLFSEALGDPTPDQRYQPTKKEIIFLAKNDFDHRLPSYKKMKKIIHRYSDDPELAMDTIEKHALMGSYMSIMMDEMNDSDLLLFSSEKEATKVAFLYHDLLKETRQWKNNGYKIKEYTEMVSATEPIISMNHLNNVTLLPQSQDEPQQKVKVGRNDPCPCGSGLKYKKCCGR